MGIYHTAYRQKGKSYAVNSGLTTAKITGNVMHFQSVAQQYITQRFAPVARHIPGVTAAALEVPC